MKKVYCTYCEHFSNAARSFTNGGSCFHTECFVIKNTPIKPEKIRIKDCKTLNKDNNCEYFEKKEIEKINE